MTRRPPRIVHLDEIEAIPGPGTLTWRPVRAHLGLRAFGTNAYTAANLGDDVVEPHDENPDLAHEELYFVARGRARFILDGESFDAPAGTYVFVPDPATHRHAVAEEVGTTVLSFGGPPTFEPSAWEWMFRAVALTESDPAQAREIVEDGIEKHPESPGLRIALARVLLGEGDEDGARAALREALEREPDAEDYVRQDAALSALL
jgi:mannose-6-phosphate isomerase-like protein (cupin superfamily)